MNKEEQTKYANDQLISQGNLKIVEQCFSADYLTHAEDKDYSGHEFIRQFTKQIRSAIPDIFVLDLKFFVKASNIIAWKHTLHGTHKANMMGIPPTYQKIKWHEMVVSRFKDDKIAEEWVVSELAGQLLLKQPKAK